MSPRRDLVGAGLAFWIASSVAALGGCSAAFVRPVTALEDGQRLPGGCTRSRVAPALDVAIASLQAARTVYAISRSDSDYQGMALPRSGDIALGIGLTTAFAVSAIYGFVATGTCREVIAEIHR